ncbi:MAG: DUF937 domain-containing protein [Zoogloeaceae bacterium]|nr:DUF937 domain-containing protein [Rhodocyclaceae bacterium]MCP5234885.1 DUF937 domain-containing protein [Zoogloeaceae bacterium]
MEAFIMGLFDQLANQVLGGGEGQASLLQLAQKLMQEEGGLQGLMVQLQQAGLGEQVSSWLGNGANLPVSPEQIRDAIGGDTLAQLAGQVGLSTEAAGQGIADYLPQLVDRLSPSGVLQGDDPLRQQGMAILDGLFGGNR